MNAFTSSRFCTALQTMTLAFALSSCAPEQNLAVELNACDLLQSKDISSILHGSVDAGERDDLGLITQGNHAGAYSSTCFWQIERGKDSTEYVILMAMQWPEDKSANIFLQEFRSSAAHGIISQDPVPLALGDESLWWGDGVAVIKGQVSFGISTRLAESRPIRRETEEALAALILPRLQ